MASSSKITSEQNSINIALLIAIVAFMLGLTAVILIFVFRNQTLNSQSIQDGQINDLRAQYNDLNSTLYRLTSNTNVERSVVGSELITGTSIASNSVNTFGPFSLGTAFTGTQPTLLLGLDWSQVTGSTNSWSHCTYIVDEIAGPTAGVYDSFYVFMHNTDTVNATNGDVFLNFVAYSTTQIIV